MNSETLRALKLPALLEELGRQLGLAQASQIGVWRECNHNADPPLPLLSIGDFDIYPRDEFRRLVHGERAQNALMRSALLAAKSVLTRLANDGYPAWSVEGRALLAVETALKAVGSTVPQETKTPAVQAGDGGSKGG